ncbi:YcfL family protein [Geobacter sp. DSM 9736]|uniref:YcfL family protein n=1 Tax=Geobacter sp. DSM 9736 TaxID=1277350 RepID=UPI000B5DF0AE|nr:YcfL family protein [Geobacter sp. DSM 9736]SNB47538.1 Uncharacterized conserved protein YcfL [Geobacter sp. DSM 9736]
MIHMTRGWMGLLVLLLGMAVLNGCGTTSGIEASGKTDWNQEGERVLGKNIIINNGSLGRDVEVVDMRSAMVGDMMTAQVSLRSKDRDTINLEYRYEWFDLQGMETGSSSAWKPLLLYSRETRTVQGIAPDPRAREFKLKLREAE